MIVYDLLKPLLFRLNPESAHNVAIWALRQGLVGGYQKADDPILATRVWDMSFPNPIGLAAGFDKHAQVIDPMLNLGFGFVEAGSVTPLPQPGNPKPRLFRLTQDAAVINRFGFNSHGLDYFVNNLGQRTRRGIVGANLGKNKLTLDAASDYEKGIEAVVGLAEYLVCNVSSPNTPGLRGLQARSQIDELIKRVLIAREKFGKKLKRLPPLLVKVGPDLDESQMADIAEVALMNRLDGLILGNTTLTRPGLSSLDADQEGGLSGAPLMSLATQCLSHFYRLTEGKIPLIGCGGVANGKDAYAKIRAGASLVQLYSALIYQGPSLILTIKAQLADLIRADGFSSIAQAVGADHR
jgi:dihydroorotate dehydrogenase